MKDCPYLSESDRNYILKLYDKALQHRMLSLEEWDSDMSQQFVDLVDKTATACLLSLKRDRSP